MAVLNTYANVTPTPADKLLGTDVSDTTADANGAAKNFLLSAIDTLFSSTAKRFTNKTAETPAPGDNSEKLATTAFVAATALTQAQAENAASAVFGQVSGQRLAQAVAARDWTYSAIAASTSGSAVDFSSLPAGLTEIDVFLENVSLDSTNSLLVQLGTGGVPTTTGYLRGHSSITSSTSVVSSTAGVPIFCNQTFWLSSGVLKFVKKPGGNYWHAVGQFQESTLAMFSGGEINLAGVCDFLRVTRITSGTFDSGNIWLRYK